MITPFDLTGKVAVVTGSSRGPSFSTKRTSWPSACGMTRMSENRIAPSKPKRRIGWSVISDAASLSYTRFRNPPLDARRARYSGRYRPA